MSPRAPRRAQTGLIEILCGIIIGDIFDKFTPKQSQHENQNLDRALAITSSALSVGALMRLRTLSSQYTFPRLHMAGGAGTSRCEDVGYNARSCADLAPSGRENTTTSSLSSTSALPSSILVEIRCQRTIDNDVEESKLHQHAHQQVEPKISSTSSTLHAAAKQLRARSRGVHDERANTNIRGGGVIVPTGCSGEQAFVPRGPAHETKKAADTATTKAVMDDSESYNKCRGARPALPPTKSHFAAKYNIGMPSYDQRLCEIDVTNTAFPFKEPSSGKRMAVRPHTCINLAHEFPEERCKDARCGTVLLPRGAGAGASPVGFAHNAGEYIDDTPTTKEAEITSKSRTLQSCGRPGLNWLGPYVHTQMVIATSRNDIQAVCDLSRTHGVPVQWSSRGLKGKDKDLAFSGPSQTSTIIYKAAAADANNEIVVQWCYWVCEHTEHQTIAIRSTRRQTTPPQSGGKPSNYQIPLAAAGGTTKTFLEWIFFDDFGGCCRGGGASTSAGSIVRRVGGASTTKAVAGRTYNKPQESKVLRNDRRRGRQDPNFTHNVDMMNKKKTNKKKRQDHDHSGQNLSSETELSDRSCAPDSRPSTFWLLYLLLLRALRE